MLILILSTFTQTFHIMKGHTHTLFSGAVHFTGESSHNSSRGGTINTVWHLTSGLAEVLLSSQELAYGALFGMDLCVRYIWASRPDSSSWVQLDTTFIILAVFFCRRARPYHLPVRVW